MPNNLIDRLRAAANTEDNHMRCLLRDAADELERLTERLTRLSIAADAVSKASQTSGGMTTELAQLDGALWRAKEEAPGVRGAIEEVDLLKAQNARLREALIACHNAHDDFYIESLDICKVIESTPAQSLAEIEARAVRNFAEEIGLFDSAYDDQEYIEVSRHSLREYVDQLSNSPGVGDRGGSGYDREVLGQNNEGDTVTV